MRLREKIAEARATHDIRDVLGTQKRSILCPLPFHQHRHATPSFSIYWLRGMQWWKCHGSCQLEGDIIDLVGYLRIAGYNPKDRAMIERALAMLDERYEPRPVLPEKTAALPAGLHRKFLPPGQPVLDYARRRGLKPKTLERFQVGQKKNGMSIPTIENGQLVGIKYRNINPNGLRYWSEEGSILGLFNHDGVIGKAGPVFMVKAEIPAMLLAQEGFLACAPNAGEGSWLDVWKDILPEVIVIGDNDGPGRELGEKRAALSGGRLVFPASEYKDIDEYLLADRERCLKQLRAWMEAK